MSAQHPKKVADDDLAAGAAVVVEEHSVGAALIGLRPSNKLRRKKVVVADVAELGEVVAAAADVAHEDNVGPDALVPNFFEEEDVLAADAAAKPDAAAVDKYYIAKYIPYIIYNEITK